MNYHRRRESVIYFYLLEKFSQLFIHSNVCCSVLSDIREFRTLISLIYYTFIDMVQLNLAISVRIKIIFSALIYSISFFFVILDNYEFSVIVIYSWYIQKGRDRRAWDYVATKTIGIQISDPTPDTTPECTVLIQDCSKVYVFSADEKILPNSIWILQPHPL